LSSATLHSDVCFAAHEKIVSQQIGNGFYVFTVSIFFIYVFYFLTILKLDSSDYDKLFVAHSKLQSLLQQLNPTLNAKQFFCAPKFSDSKHTLAFVDLQFDILKIKVQHLFFAPSSYFFISLSFFLSFTLPFSLFSSFFLLFLFFPSLFLPFISFIFFFLFFSFL
jgi:hypothetical protein